MAQKQCQPLPPGQSKPTPKCHCFENGPGTRVWVFAFCIWIINGAAPHQPFNECLLTYKLIERREGKLGEGKPPENRCLRRRRRCLCRVYACDAPSVCLQ